MIDFLVQGNVIVIQGYNGHHSEFYYYAILKRSQSEVTLQWVTKDFIKRTSFTVPYYIKDFVSLKPGIVKIYNSNHEVVWSKTNGINIF